MNRFFTKLREALFSVVPISAVVLLLNRTIAPLNSGVTLLFCCGAVLLILGMGLFTLGADLSMMPVGERIGAKLSASRNLLLMVLLCLGMGVAITVAEPDLQVLATQVPAVPNLILIGAVAAGVGLFLAVALLRIVFQKKLSVILLLLYGLVFLLAAFAPADYVAVAFDSGGVTTGPITVPFIMALGIGLAGVRGGTSSHDDSFGLVALCSVGPILAVLFLGMIYPAQGAVSSEAMTYAANDLRQAAAVFLHSFPHYAKEVLTALLPIALFFILFQLLFLHLPKQQVIKAGVGLLYTFIGLVLFLTGVNVGFLPAGRELGTAIASLPNNWILIPIGMVLGCFVVLAEPAVHVLTKQVSELTGGAISRRAMLTCLSGGVALSIGIAMIRVLTGLSIWACILPGYLFSLGLTLFVPPIFTAVAFDSGGVASGPMTATFILPFAMGACSALGGDLLTDAFGVVALVAMTPLVTIQLLGLLYRLGAPEPVTVSPVPLTAELYPDIIDL